MTVENLISKANKATIAHIRPGVGVAIDVEWWDNVEVECVEYLGHGIVRAVILKELHMRV